MTCTYAPASGTVEHYTGRITKIGADLGFVSTAVMVWAVFAPAINCASTRALIRMTEPP